jgi:hypothetical protein
MVPVMVPEAADALPPPWQTDILAPRILKTWLEGYRNDKLSRDSLAAESAAILQFSRCYPRNEPKVREVKGGTRVLRRPFALRDRDHRQLLVRQAIGFM